VLDAQNSSQRQDEEKDDRAAGRPDYLFQFSGCGPYHRKIDNLRQIKRRRHSERRGKSQGLERETGAYSGKDNFFRNQGKGHLRDAMPWSCSFRIPPEKAGKQAEEPKG
jgi:hypothetical protein